MSNETAVRGRSGSFPRVRLVSWTESAQRLRTIRTSVFVVEQNVPADLEDDGLDPDSIHALAEDGEDRPIGTGRLLHDGRIGRMAVLPECRGRGVGAALLHALMAAARERGLREVHLHAQTRARAFYERHGFEVDGDAFIEAGIPHVNMRAAL